MPAAPANTRADAVQVLLTDLHRGVEALTEGDDWRHFLDVAQRFHRYSFLNTLAILVQRPEATRVAGYRRWQQLGRQVRRGERGIRILAPVTTRQQSTTPDTAPESTPDAEEQPRVVLRGFRVARVFDLSQTDGEPLPEPPVHVLTGDAPDGLTDDLRRLIEREGFTYDLGDLDGHPGAYGLTDYAARTVTVRTGLAAAQRTKTTTHELAHVLLHRPGDELPRERREVEAESVAYVVCAAHGLPTGDYSLGYVATWSRGDLDVVRATGERVLTCARRVLDSLGLDAAPIS